MKRLVLALIVLFAVAPAAHATRLLKQSTAYNLQVFMAASSDHVTGKTGLTLTITASKDGASFASITPTVTELANGWYKLALTSSHTDTVGDLAVHVTGTDADPSDLVVQVRANALGDTLPANVVAVAAKADTWYVATAGNGGSDSNNGKSWGTPFLTLGAAQTAAKDGDTINVGSGTFTIAAGLSVSKSLTFRGVSRGGTVVTSSNAGANTFEIGADSVSIENMRIVSSGTNSSGVSSFLGNSDLRLENCTLEGVTDGFLADSVAGLIVRRCKASSQWDGAYVSSCPACVVEDSEFVSLGTYAASDEHFAGFRAIAGGDSDNGTATGGVFRNNICRAARSGTSAGAKTTAGGVFAGDWVLAGNRFVAEATNASYTGAVYGVSDNNQNSRRGRLTVDGGSIFTSSAGSGTVRDVNTAVAGSLVDLQGVKYAAAKIGGAGTIVDRSPTASETNSAVVAGTVGVRALLALPAVAPAANGGLPTVDASNRVAGVSGNVAGSVGSVTGNVGGSVASVTGNLGGNVTGSVGSVTGNVGGNVVGSVGSVTAGVGLADGAITAAKIASGAITGAKFDGSTAFAQTGDAFARLGAPAGASVAADIAAVATSASAVQAKLPSASAKMAGEGATAKNLDQVSGGGGGAPTAAENAAAVWDYLSADADTANSMGLLLNEFDFVTPGNFGLLQIDADGRVASDVASYGGDDQAGENAAAFFGNDGDESTALVDDVGQGGLDPIAPTWLNKARYWFPGRSGDRADNIVTVKGGAIAHPFSGTLGAVMPLNTGDDGAVNADIASVVSVTMTGPAAYTPTNFAVRADGKAIHFDVPELAVTGAYTVLVVGWTKDGQQIPLECKLVVR